MQALKEVDYMKREIENIHQNVFYNIKQLMD